MLTQVYSNTKNVKDATQERIEFIFDNYENISVSISGGKDSTVLAHYALREASKRGRKIEVFFLDEEVMYQSSINQVSYLMTEMYPDAVIPMWYQIEFNLTNAVGLGKTQLKCWQSGKNKEWMRKRRKDSIKYAPWSKSEEIVSNKTIGLDFYDVIKNHEKMHTNTAFLVGLRTAESPNRWRAVAKNPVDVNGNMIYWATKKTGGNASFYPIYDWSFSDIWRYIGDNELRYNKIYDYQLKKGYGINEMRISSLIHEKSYKSICDLPEFEPKTYNKLVKRVKGVSFGQETGKDDKMFKVKKLPKNFKKWSDYRDFLLKTYPDRDLFLIFANRFKKHLENEYVARQQCRQLVLNDYENNLPIDNKPDPRQQLIDYYMEVL